jgi:hypothetical protein
VLSALSVVRPIGWTIQSYLQARDLPRHIMVLEVAKVILLIGFVAALGQIGPVWACAGVGLAFTAHAIGSMTVIQRRDAIRIATITRGMIGPAAACGVMAVGVLAMRSLVDDLGGVTATADLVISIATGAVVYLGAAWVLAPTTTRDCIGLIRRSFGREQTGADGAG